MNPTALQRLPSAVIALFLVLLLSSWFAPGGEQVRLQQIDFWVAWLVCMVVLALPLTLLETALARRSQASPLHALSTLTREADVKPVWRSVGWLAIGVMALFAGGLAKQSATIVQPLLPDAPLFVVQMVFGIAMLAASLIPRLMVWLGVVCAIVAVELSTFDQGIGSWGQTPFSLHEWASAVVLALVASGLGMGLYWQQSLQQTADKASVQALPIWAAQVIGGVLFALAQGIHGHVALPIYAAALLAGGAYLTAMVRVQLAARGVAGWMQWLLIGSVCALWLVPWTPILTVMASIMGLLVCAAYAVFSGWLMKISHLRKALNFEQEWVYNLWRVAMRVVLPLAVLLALMGLVQGALHG